ncbi:CHAT domain-containing protein [Actinoplanes hulinensis]|uniref:CHAT domain-containing protein n=1 Tax=Actinoplanes hulinensis TaxID=1144547 RepID=A0ABS7B851_9ACTN|nr:CHAT domain-containing protein [Actinoplanes hulinensis]MBW6436463.1 CHAT domain-containing protein [Actinoplanes hulinensis]
MDEDAERYAVIAAALAGHAPIADAVGALRSVPAGGPYRGALAAGLIDRFVADEQSQLFGDREPLEALIAIGDGDPPAGPSWPRTRALGRSAALAMAALRYDLPNTADALEELDELAATITDGDRAGRIHLERARLAVSMYHAVIDGDDPFQSEAWQRFRKLADDGPPEAVALGEAIDISQALMNDPHTDLDARLERLREVAARLPDTAARSLIESTADQIRQVIGGDLDAIPSTSGRGAEALHMAASVIGPLSAEDATEEDLDRAVDRMRAALAASPDDPHQRIVHLTGLAVVLARRAEAINDIGDLPEAERLLVEAQGLLSGPQDRGWEIVHEGLSQVRQRMGVEQDSYLDAVVSLRTHVWRVLMQPDAAGAAAVAREAGDAAVSAARGCLRVHDVAGAVRALDAGRGLALYAATEMRSVPDLLRDAGRDDLAAGWQRAIDADGPAPGLRRRVFGVLADIAPGGALFDPPEIDEIRDALSELDLDGLVYLVPSSDVWPGLAVAVPAEGELSYLGLPALKPADSPEVDDYLATMSSRDSAAVGRGGNRDLVPDDDLTDRLDIVRDWAWRAAMGPIIDSVLPTWTHVPGHRVPRMALVPMGELALIPWQAACRAGGEPAIRTVAFSQAASARMLLRSAALPPVAPSRLGLIVADPATGAPAVDLHGARDEASAIHDVLYRGARYLGRMPGDGAVSPSGEGTPEQVRAWLTSTGRAAGTMLHLACHGVADPDGGSYLMLAGQRLAAEELVKLMTAVPERAVGLVVLAACSSGMAARDYDEAYSLGTAFLAGGARSVLSTQWTIPDSSTSLLMFMFHHHLMTERLPVWEALHRAQLWMLDPDREVPGSMPARLSAQLDDGDPADVTGWAGFLHGGR